MTHVSELKERFTGRLIFSVNDAMAALKKKGVSKVYVQLLLHNSSKKNEIIRLGKGKYTFNKDIMATGFAFTPFYYGMQEALSLRNLWEQETNPVILTIKKIKPGVRKINSTNVVVRRLNRKYFFGFDLLKYYDFEIPVSDIEKTIIDFVYYREYISPEIIKEIKEKIDRRKLNQYLAKYPVSIRNKVILLLK
jgi:predicted transcriptional regulator of viral defense system